MIFEDVPWDIIIGVTALVLSIIGIYYTYKSVKVPILLEARKRHTQELIKFLKEWRDKIPPCETAIDPIITPTSSTSISYLNEHRHLFLEIELDWKYKDLIQYHLPKEYKTLPEAWERYKKFVEEYGRLRYQLYEKIKKDVIEKTNLKFDPDCRDEHTISQHFITSIYRQCISLIRDRRLYYDKNLLIPR